MEVGESSIELARFFVLVFQPKVKPRKGDMSSKVAKAKTSTASSSKGKSAPNKATRAKSAPPPLKVIASASLVACCRVRRHIYQVCC